VMTCPEVPDFRQAPGPRTALLTGALQNSDISRRRHVAAGLL